MGPYNFASCRQRGWKSFASLVTPFYRWVEVQPFGHRPLMLAEYRTIDEGRRGQGKAQWFSGVAAAASRLPALKALVYFDYPSPPASCDWVSSSPQAAATAFAALAHSGTFAPTARLHA